MARFLAERSFAVAYPVKAHRFSQVVIQRNVFAGSGGVHVVFLVGAGEAIVAVAGMAELPLCLAVGADAIDGIRAALESRPAKLEKSAQRGRLAQQH